MVVIYKGAGKEFGRFPPFGAEQVKAEAKSQKNMKTG
jgi:hypothetical protein